jgi:hypothetical protein
MLSVFILRNSRYTQEVMDKYNIYFSQFFHQFVTFNPSVTMWYPGAVESVVEFGDLALNPVYDRALHKAFISVKVRHKHS